MHSTSFPSPQSAFTKTRSTSYKAATMAVCLRAVTLPKLLRIESYGNLSGIILSFTDVQQSRINSQSIPGTKSDTQLRQQSSAHTNTFATSSTQPLAPSSLTHLSIAADDTATDSTTSSFPLVVRALTQTSNSNASVHPHRSLSNNVQPWLAILPPYEQLLSVQAAKSLSERSSSYESPCQAGASLMVPVPPSPESATSPPPPSSDHPHTPANDHHLLKLRS